MCDGIALGVVFVLSWVFSSMAQMPHGVGDCESIIGGLVGGGECVYGAAGHSC